LAAVQQWTACAGLTLRPDKTRLIDAASDAFEFLGFRFDKGRRWVRHKCIMKLRDTIRARPTCQRRLSEGHDRADQPGAAGLVRLL
jgi:hypothetical protein